MGIKYNSNKRTTFNNYIDVAISNLKKTETETSCILNFTFPSKTIIGRRFDKKSKITTLKGNINSAYTSLSTVRADVQEQVKKYVRENENVALLLWSDILGAVTGQDINFRHKEENSEIPLEECLELAKNEYYKNGKSDKYYDILDQNHNWFWYETSNGRKIKPGSSQYEYYIATGKDMTLKTSKEFLELLDTVGKKKHGEYEDEGYLNYVINGFIKADFKSMYKESDENCNKFFETNFDGWYGTDQGMFKYYEEHYKENSFDKATIYLIHQYGMDFFDACDALEAIDSIGACSYANIANQIIYAYKDKPDKFEKTFGFPMYDVEDGQLNNELLLADLYIYANEGTSFITEKNIVTNKKTVTLNKDNFYYKEKKNTSNKIAKVKEQNYLSGLREGIDVDKVNDYLNLKNSQGDNIQFAETLIDVNETKELSNRQIKDIVEISLESENSIGVGIFPSEENPTMFTGLKTDDTVCDGGHAVTVTDVIEEGIVVSSWGRKYVITFDELKKNKFYISILSHN